MNWAGGLNMVILVHMLNKFLHKISHLLKWNYGTVESFWDGDVLMIGFRCTCGELQNDS